MGEILIVAEGPNTHSYYLGNNSESDQVIVDIKSDFSGTLEITSNAFDGILESIEFIVPPGFDLVLVNSVPWGNETPQACLCTYHLYNKDGEPVATVSTTVNTVNVTCFANGTLIEVAGNEYKKIEDVKVGDLIQTHLEGLQQVEFVHSNPVSSQQLAIKKNLQPVLIPQDSMGRGYPASNLYVSQQHRVLVASNIVERIYGSSEVFVPAKSLEEYPSIEIVQPIGELTYFHIGLKKHSVLFANGLPAESFYPGMQALKNMDLESLSEVKKIYPEIRQNREVELARPSLTFKQGRKLIERHLKNSRALLGNFQRTNSR